MNIGENGKNLIKSFEGLRLTSYKALPTEQYYTIGYGHYGSDVKPNTTITKQRADELFDTDIKRYVQAVDNCKLGFVPNQNQFDSLVSFCYNLGTGIMNDFVGKKADVVAREMLLYVNSGGNKIQGLVNRRSKEYELFKTEFKEVDRMKKIVTYYGDLDILSAILVSQKNRCPIMKVTDYVVSGIKADTVIQIGGKKEDTDRFVTFKNASKLV